MIKHTKIVATLGPSCESVEILEDMVKSGLNVARLNFSHGTYENHALLIKNIRAVEEKTGEPIAIMQDIQGPRIRLGILPEKGVEIKAGDSVVINTKKSEYDSKELPLDYPGLEKFLKPGERILISDGKVELKINEIKGSEIYCQVIEGDILSSHKGLNLPDSQLPIPVLSDKDKEDLEFGVKMGVDIVALSFVRNAQDILDARFILKKFAKELKADIEPTFLVAKIERHEALTNIEEIIDEADGVMVARGDLAMEITMADLPLVQKRIIDLANHKVKPVIVATQMLDSMQKSSRPTRAEITDVANAVIDHADALMLSNETAVGNNPVLVVKTMSDIIMATEKSVYDDTRLPLIRKKETSVEIAVTELSRILAEEVRAKLILAASISGETGRLISHVRPELPIMVATSTERVRRQLNLSWGINPFVLQPCSSIEELVERSVAYIKKHRIAKQGDYMIVVAGEPVGQAGNINLMEVRGIK